MQVFGSMYNMHAFTCIFICMHICTGQTRDREARQRCRGIPRAVGNCSYKWGTCVCGGLWQPQNTGVYTHVGLGSGLCLSFLFVFLCVCVTLVPRIMGTVSDWIMHMGVVLRFYVCWIRAEMHCFVLFCFVTRTVIILPISHIITWSAKWSSIISQQHRLAKCNSFCSCPCLCMQGGSM